MNSAEAMKLLLSNRRYFIETLMAIEDKNRQLVPFILNPVQSDIHETSTGRDVYVKPAQVGASSYFICDFLIDCITVPGTTSVIISYDEFITGRLLRKAQNFYDILLDRIPSIPKLHHKSTSEKTFQDVNSSFYICSARGFAMPRGETIHNLLFDEFGFWPPGAAEEVFAAALQRVPLLLNTKVRALSTPHGEDNDFYELYMAAKEGKEVGQSTFKAHFYTWYQHPEYSLAHDNPFVLPGDEIPILDNLDADEANLMLRFEHLGIDYEEANNKIRWRRYKIAEMSSLRRSGETRLLFPQEFPEDDVTCFQAAGDMWYDSELLMDMAKNCYPAPIHNLFADIWYPVEEGVKYLLAIDPGLAKTSESVGTVWTFTEGDGNGILPEFKHCATLSGLYAGKEMADKCKELGKFYNGALIANEDSLDITSHLADYPDLYYRTDPVTGRVGKDIGWQTTRSTKPYMCNELSRHLSKITTHDIRIISQCRNIRAVLTGGKVLPLSVGADDYHDSAAIAIVCRTALPIERGFVGTSGWSEDWGR